VNIGFRDPLTPGDAWEAATGPAPTAAIRVLGHGSAPTGGHRLEPGPRTVVLAGDGAGSRAVEFATATGLPLLAEPSSGARGGETAVRYRPALAGELGER